MIESDLQPDDYWTDARRPLSCLLFLTPLILIYEIGILALDASESSIRNGADYWLRSLLEAVGLNQVVLLPLLVVGAFVTAHVLKQHPWEFRLDTQVGMLAESILLAVMLIAVGQVHHLLFLSLGTPDVNTGPQGLSIGPLSQAVSFIGAGVYEEVMFRLLLVPAAYYAFRLFEFPKNYAAMMAAFSTAFLFAMAHHIGPHADAFNLFSFSFRTAAGVFFAAIFFLRGFGITVGCHAAYDLLVGLVLAGTT